MADTSTYLRDAFLNAALRGATLTGITPRVSLHTADPGLTGANEVTGDAYARQAATFGAPATGGTGRQVANSAAVTFASLDSATSRTVTHAGVWDAATLGNFLYRIDLAASKVVNAGDPAEFAIGDLTVDQA